MCMTLYKADLILIEPHTIDHVILMELATIDYNSGSQKVLGLKLYRPEPQLGSKLKVKPAIPPPSHAEKS